MTKLSKKGRNFDSKQQTKTFMKLLISAFCASLFILPSAFAGSTQGFASKQIEISSKKSAVVADSDCGKCKKGEQKEEAIVADCGKCKKSEKKEGEEVLLADSDCGKCKKGEPKEETLLADGDCGKCKKGEPKEETLLADGDCGKCKKGEPKEEGTIVA